MTELELRMQLLGGGGNCYNINDNADLLAEILARLDGRSLAAAACVCRLWAAVARRDAVWEALCLRHVGPASGPRPARHPRRRRRARQVPPPLPPLPRPGAGPPRRGGAPSPTRTPGPACPSPSRCRSSPSTATSASAAVAAPAPAGSRSRRHCSSCASQWTSRESPLNRRTRVRTRSHRRPPARAIRAVRSTPSRSSWRTCAATSLSGARRLT